jgi:uncharacterized protein (DUF983 family)
MRKKLNSAKSGVDFQQLISPHAFTGHHVVIINPVELNILIGGRKMTLRFYDDVRGRWKISVIGSVVLALFVFTPTGFYVFGFMLPVVWLALALGIALFTVLSFVAKEEKRKRSLIGASIALISISYLGLASWLRFDAFMF